MQLTRRRLIGAAGLVGAFALSALSARSLVQNAGDTRTAMRPTEEPASMESLAQAAKKKPIALVINERETASFGYYLGEILRAEGLNGFVATTLSDLDLAYLPHFAIVLLSPGSLLTSEVEMFGSYVANGGRLVAMRPDKHLATLLGLKATDGVIADGFMIPCQRLPFAAKLAPMALQFHGEADLYFVETISPKAFIADITEVGNGTATQVLATLASNDRIQLHMPAVTLHRFGRGLAAIWTYDLARSVAYTRQGHPTWADKEKFATSLVRPADMFDGWLDLEQAAVPQADEQQRLLANLLTYLSACGGPPLPRIWYFPTRAQGVLIATSDAHQNSGAAVEEVVKRAEKYNGHISIYYLPPVLSPLYGAAWSVRWMAADLRLMDPAYLPSPSQIEGWRARGHEFGLHPVVGSDPWVDWPIYTDAFSTLGYGAISSTTRTHLARWHGWVETAWVQAAMGIRMNLDFYHYGAGFRHSDGTWAHGHFIGSGLPMKFVDETGQVLDIYQQPTQLADDYLLSLEWAPQANLSAAEATEISTMYLRNSVNGQPSAIAANFHTDPYEQHGPWAALKPQAEQWMEGTFASALSLGVPIMSAERWLEFTETRHDATLDQIAWSVSTESAQDDCVSGSLHFMFSSRPIADVSLTILLPSQHGHLNLSEVRVDNSSVEYAVQIVGGLQFASLTVAAGSHHISARWA